MWQFGLAGSCGLAAVQQVTGNSQVVAVAVAVIVGTLLQVDVDEIIF